MRFLRYEALATLLIALTTSAASCYSSELKVGPVELAIIFGEHAENLRAASRELFDSDKKTMQTASKLNRGEIELSFSINEKLIELRKASEAMNSALLIASFTSSTSVDAVTRHLTAMCSALALNPMPGSSAWTLAELWRTAAGSDYPKLKMHIEKVAGADIAATEAAANNCAVISTGNWAN